jgi:VanZ family protein
MCTVIIGMAPVGLNRPEGATLRTPVDNRGTQRRHRFFLAYVVAMMLAFLVPVPTTPLAEVRHVDKLVHFGVFFGFALLFYIDRHWRAWWIFLVGVAFAGAIELVQWFLPYRDADWLDLLAGAAGTAVGILLMLLIERQVNGGSSRSAPRS